MIVTNASPFPRVLLMIEDTTASMELCRNLSGNGYLCSSASSLTEALIQLRNGDFHLVVAEMNPHTVDGLPWLEQIRQINLSPAVIVISESNDVHFSVQCMKRGAYDYIHKSVVPSTLASALSLALEKRETTLSQQHSYKRIESDAQSTTQLLEETVRQLQRSKQLLHDTQEEIIQRLSIAAEFRDEDTWNHLFRISKSSFLIAQRMNLSDEFSEILRIASPLHDIGKIGIPDSILLKPGKLTSEEYTLMKTHTTIGAKILEGSRYPLIKMARDIALYHHEKFDGSGYPNGVKGEDIPIPARIVAVVDVFDALTSKRPYKPAWPIDKTLDTMIADKGKHFEPEIVDVLLETLESILTIREKETAESYSALK